MTNAHVVEGAEEVIVTLTDKREFKAKIIGADKRTDVALVKIEATGLPVVRIGDVNRLKVGEWVIAIGSPFGLENTVTAGIVSAKARDTGDFLPLIQTDVAINPGNSGGPLINMRGEVVGINSQIYSRSGGYMGISFAIPIDEAIARLRQLRVSGRVIRGPHRRADRPGDEGGGRVDRPGQAAWARWSAASRPAARPRRPASRPATSSPSSRAAPSTSPATCRAWSGGTKPGSKATLQVFRRGDLQGPERHGRRVRAGAAAPRASRARGKRRSRRRRGRRWAWPCPTSPMRSGAS